MGASLNAFTSREQTVYYSTSACEYHLREQLAPLSFENILMFAVKCFEKDKERAVEFLSDVLLNSKMEDDWVSNERNVILLEMKVRFTKSKHISALYRIASLLSTSHCQHVNDMPDELVFDHLHSVAYSGTALGFTILGPEENVR